MPPSRRPARVLAYLRVSGAEQGRSGTSLEAQRDEIGRYCAAAGLPSPAFFTEVESGSAERTEARTEQLRLQSEARAGDVVLVCAVDRWSRDIVHAVSSVRALVARGIAWRSIRESIDASMPHGDSTLGIMSWTADQERRRIRDRTVGRRLELKASGVYIDPVVPLGYVRAPGDRRGRSIVVDPETAEHVRQAFALSASGRSLAEIAAVLPVPASRASWDKEGIQRLLRNRVYLGEVQATPGVWVAGQHPAIVPRELWERAHEGLAARRLGGRRHSGESRTASWILRTRARCGACGAKMSAGYRNGGRPKDGYLDYYVCARRIRPAGARCEAPYVRQDAAERDAAALVEARLVELRHELARARGPVAPAPCTRTDHAPAIEALAKRRARVLDMAERGQIDPAETARRLAKIDGERGKLATATAAEERAEEDARAAADPARRRSLLANVRALRAAWAAMPPAGRRRVVELLCDRAELRAGEAPRMVWRPVEALLAGR